MKILFLIIGFVLLGVENNRVSALNEVNIKTNSISDNNHKVNQSDHIKVHLIKPLNNSRQNIQRRQSLLSKDRLSLPHIDNDTKKMKADPHHLHIHRHGLHTHVHRHGASDEQRVLGVAPGLLMISLFGVMMGGQALLVWWKRHYYRSYQNVTLLLLWTLPLIFSIYYYYIRFIIVHVIFSIFSVRNLLLAMQQPLARTTPRAIYAWFYRIHYICNFIGLIGYTLLVLAIFFNLHWNNEPLVPMGFLLCFYSLYFGVVSRDIAEMCTNRMASQMGVANLKDGTLPSHQPRANMCAICGENLLSSVRATDSNKSKKEENIMMLDCKHQFHEHCVRGWTIIGKKDTCPYCNEKVDLKKAVLKNPWEKQSVAWGQILDAVRYLVVWNPIIVSVLQLVLNFLPHTYPMLISKSNLHTHINHHHHSS